MAILKCDCCSFPKRRREMIEAAVDEANLIMKDMRFLGALSKLPNFPYSGNVNGADIARWIENYGGATITVKGYNPGWWHRRVLGRFRPAFPERIELSTRRLRRPFKSIVNTIIHEFIHALDDQMTDESFGHGSNSRKPSAAPYRVGSLAELFVSSGPFGD